MNQTVKILLLFALLPMGGGVAHAQSQWQQVEPGVWKCSLGIPEHYSLLSAAGCKSLSEGFDRLPSVTLPALAYGIKAWQTDGKTMLTIPLKQGEHLYGFGLNFQTVQQRGKIFNLHVDHYGGKDNGRTHAPVPFYVSSAGYGILINSARYLTVYAGTSVRKDSQHAPQARDRNTDRRWTSRPASDEVAVVVPASGVEVYLFAGPTPLDVVRRYNLLCGGGTLPPRWGLGFTQRTKSLYSAQQVLAEVDSFARRGYPLDFIGLEPGWQSKSYPCTFEWDTTRYPDPKGFLAAIRSRQVRVNLWTNPYVSPASGIYHDIYPWSGSHTVWCGLVPDLVSPQGRAIWGNKFKKEHLAIGVSGYKIDEIDGYDHYLWPDVATFPSGTAAEQMRQTYGLLVQRTTYDLFHELGKRTYGLVRGSNAGGASMPYVIYNDYYSHQDFITALINSGFCGVLWTPEVRSSKNAEEWIRRFQTVVFSPMAMLNAWSSGTKPWSFPEVAEAVKYYALLRMQMMPYWYTTFARYHFDGLPPFRSLNLDYGELDVVGMAKEMIDGNLDTNPYLEKVSNEIKDQYMAGDCLMVAPLFAGQTSRRVVLPPGRWYDFYSGKYVGNNQIVVAAPGRDRIPIYVKDGGIVPMMAARLHTPARGEQVDIEVRHYGQSSGTYQLYDDDGETFDYEQGSYSWRTITVTVDAKGRPHGSVSKPVSGKPCTVRKVTFRYMTLGAKPQKS